MAHAQRLQEQVNGLTERCHQLEKELARAQGTDAGEGPSHTLPDSITTVSEGLGSLSIGFHGQAKYHGETSSSEYFQDLLPISSDNSSSDGHSIGLPPDIEDLFNAFPFGFRDHKYTKGMFVDHIPEYSLARELVELYFVNAGWMYEPVAPHDFQTNILQALYDEGGTPTISTIHCHQLALFFIVIANGYLYTNNPDRGRLSKFYESLCRASFSMDSILAEATVATVQTLFLIVRFIFTAERDRNEERWLLVGLNCRLAHMLGLQRDSATWKLSDEDVQQRRRAFWELFVWDSWTSLVNGRPCALAVQYTDCQFPEDIDPQVGPDGTTEIGWHAWKFRYTASILTASTYHVFNPKTPPYKALLELDKKIRTFPQPNYLRSPHGRDTTRSWNPDPSRAMMQYCAICLRESNLLYIHRSYFAQALKEMPKNPLSHPYAASVLTTYRSASRMIASLRSVFNVHPGITSTAWFFWSGVFSSCIVLGALVTESPTCELAKDALQEFRAAVPFFEKGALACGSKTTVPVLEKLLNRAQAAFHAGSAVEANTSSADDKLELQLLGGRKTVINTTSGSNAGSPSAVASTRSSTADMEEPPSYASSGGSEKGAMEQLQEYQDARAQRNQRSHGHGGHAFEGYRTDQAAGYGGHASFHSQTAVGGPPTEVASPAAPFARDSAYITASHGHHPVPVNYDRPPPLQVSHSADSIESHGSVQHHVSLHHHHQSGHWDPSAPWNSPVGHQGHTAHLVDYRHQAPVQNDEPYYTNAPHQGYTAIVDPHRPGAPHAQTQQEIWRDFMMSYQQNG